jgi:hypothetical protein
MVFALASEYRVSTWTSARIEEDDNVLRGDSSRAAVEGPFSWRRGDWESAAAT